MQRDTIFISYSRADSSGRDALVKHLEVVLGKPPRIRIFADTSIETGEEWRNRIRNEMDRALVVVLLVSADFLTSEFVQSVEIPRAALAARRGEAVIACLYVRHCAAEAFRIHVDDPNGKGFDIRVTDYQGLNDPNTPMARKGAKREQLLAQAAGKIVELAETRLKAEEEKRQREAEAKAKEEAEAKAKAEEARLKAEAEARVKAEAEAKAEEEAEAKRKAEEKRRQREARAKRKAEALELKRVPSEDKVQKSQEEAQSERQEKLAGHWKRLPLSLVLGVPILALIGIAAFLIISYKWASIGYKQKTDESTDTYRIAVIPKGTTHWKSIQVGAVMAEWELNAAGVNVEVIWKGPLKENDRESQVNVVDDFITLGVSGIVLAPLDDAALRIPVKDAVNNGIPVVIIDSGLKREDYTSFVAMDDYIGGRKGGERLAEILGGKGKVIMLRYQKGSAGTTNREQGFLDVLKEKYPDIEVVSANQYGGATTESAYMASENLLALLRSAEGGLTIDGIFCPNESTAFAMLRALEDSDLAGKVKYVGFDSSERLVQGLRKGHIHGLVLQDTINMGYLGVKTIVAHLQGQKVEKRIDTGSAVATRENMDDQEMRYLLEPDFKKLLNE